MNLTKESEYALRGLVRLATYPPGQMVSHAEIAEAEQLPASFLAKIFQKLARHGVLEVERGRGNGYTLRATPERTPIAEVLAAVEGPEVLKRCLLWGAHRCETTPCPLHHRMGHLRERVDEMLNAMTLAEFVRDARDAPQPGTLE